MILEAEKLLKHELNVSLVPNKVSGLIGVDTFALSFSYHDAPYLYDLQ